MTGSGYSIFRGTMADMTYVQIEDAARAGAIVLLPIGVIEEHGPHLPLGVDVYGACICAERSRFELNKKGLESIIAPPFYWGMNYCTGSFPGTFTVREETMIGLIWDIMASLRRWGFEKVFVINHHYDRDHTRVLDAALRKSRLEIGIRAYLIIEESIAKSSGFKGREPHVLIYRSSPKSPSGFLEIHADHYETGLMLHYFPDLVAHDVLKNLEPTSLTPEDFKVWRHGWEEARALTPGGFVGNPAGGTPEQGKAAIEEYGAKSADIIELFLKGQYQAPDLGR
jgi:creatinine amidohydrolase